ncbi:Membrane protein involved in the export of O-antigen and teichoic acid [Desulfonatronum zhilinae]|nr:Membrane protein involved in the export of O-antigen and teichoic acid [Desulfonatronum zhilinae]
MYNSYIVNRIRNLYEDRKFSEIIKGATWAISAKILATIFGLATSVIIARMYGAEVFGIVAVLQSFFILTTIFTVLGTSTSILRLIPEHLTRYSPTSAFNVYRKTQYMVAGVSAVTGLILFLCSGFIAEKIFSKPHLQYYFSLASVFILFKSLMLLNQQAVRGLRLFRIFAFLQLLQQLAKLFILVPLTFFVFHPDDPIHAFLASIAITAIVGAWIMARAFRRESAPGDIVHPMSLKDILVLSLPMLATATMMFVIGQTGVLILGMLRPDAEVGVYAVAVKLASLTSFVMTAINSMAAPKFSELYHAGKMDELFYVAQKSAKLIFWTTTPVLVALVLFGKSILQILFGFEFIVAYPALVLLVLGQFVNSIAGSTGFFMNMTDNQNTFKNIVFIAAVSNVVLNILLTPRYGIHGAAIAAMISMMTWNIATLCFMKLKFGKTTGYFPRLSINL